MESSFEGQAAVTALAFLAGGDAGNRLALLPGRAARLHHASTLALRTWPRPSAVPASAESWHGHAAVAETAPCHRMDMSRLREPRLSRRLLPGRRRRMETPRPAPGPDGLFASCDACSLSENLPRAKRRASLVVGSLEGRGARGQNAAQQGVGVDEPGLRRACLGTLATQPRVLRTGVGVESA